MKRTAKQAVVVDAKQAVLDAFWRVARRHGSPVAPAMVRAEAGLDKAAFDAACLELMREGSAYMAAHDHALMLPESERSELVTDGKGNYYCSFSLRGLNCWRRQPDGTWAPDRAA
jgi:hypothetical protein